MARIGFIGLGNMGLPMALNLVKARHSVAGYDVSAAPSQELVVAGGSAAASIAAAASGVDVVITMLPAGKEVREVYLGAAGVLASAAADTLLVDSSTIDVATARAVAAAADSRGLPMLDAPVSGGVGGAKAATLTFMVGGSDAAFDRARPLLETMGRTIVHAGGPGNGQAAKICNNMILGISMIA
ncbi:MAG TPA: NAD(P)-binding domain-containing protein, partial [Xanthobacteraceae bacterium]|nr:NAD(P)-binding domain-containing protein [Xanthobacteraceae bacterium]